MSDTVARRSRRAQGETPARSVRVPEDAWGGAKRRAAYEGTTISNVVVLLLDGYAKGLLNLPKVTVQYEQPKPDQPVGPYGVGVNPGE